MLAAAAFCAAALIPSAAAQQACTSRAELLDALALKYKEAPVAIGVTNSGGIVEVLTTDNGDTWTIILSDPDGQSCAWFAGEGWRHLWQPVDEGPAV